MVDHLEENIGVDNQHNATNWTSEETRKVMDYMENSNNDTGPFVDVENEVFE